MKRGAFLRCSIDPVYESVSFLLMVFAESLELLNCLAGEARNLNVPSPFKMTMGMTRARFP
jgi:hypothetical protein